MLRHAKRFKNRFGKLDKRLEKLQQLVGMPEVKRDVMGQLKFCYVMTVRLTIIFCTRVSQVRLGVVKQVWQKCYLICGALSVFLAGSKFFNFTS